MPIRLTAGPSSADDRFTVSETAAIGTLSFNVRANDGKQSSRALHSLDNGQVTDLESADAVGNATTSTDRSMLGAKIWINADGTVGYSAASIQATIDALAPGETLEDSFLYALSTSNSAGQWSTVRVTITGTNDAPVARADVAAVAENAVITGSVATNDSDVDNGAVLSFASTGPNLVSGFAMGSNGSWSFDSSAAVYQNLAQGEVRTVVVNYTATDQYGASSASTLTITVTGTNDAPTAQIDGGVTALDEGSVWTGQLVGRDVDNGAVLTFSASGSLPAGVTIAADGSYRFDANDPAYQSLAAGQNQPVLLVYRVTDQFGASATGSLSFTVRGTNDAPVVTPASAAVIEDGQASGLLVATDPDSGAQLSFSVAGAAPDGFTMDAAGAWQFDASGSQWQSLRAGETATLTIPVTVTDTQGAHSSSVLTITVTGTNDAASVSGATVIHLTEDDVYDAADVVIADADRNEGGFADFTYVEGEYGFGWFGNTDGGPRWSYEVKDDPWLQSLAAGDTVTDSFTVQSVDGTPLTFDVVVSGVNDAPVAANVSARLDEDETIRGQLTASDVDRAAVLTYAVTGAVPEGFALNADGSWSMDCSGPAWQSLAKGESRDVAIDYRVTDEHGATSDAVLTVTIVGTNDAPVPVARTFAVIEDEVYTGQLLAQDADIGATLTYAAVGSLPAGVTFQSDGRWTFDGVAYASLKGGQEQTVTADYVVTDEFGAATPGVLSFRITGRNDTPTAQASSAVLSEDGSASGQLIASDPDADTGLEFALVGSAPSGFAMNEAGQWTYTPDAALQAMVAGQSQSFTVNFTATDEAGSTASSSLTLTVQGANDAPVSVASVVSVAENVSAAGKLIATDADSGAVLTFASVAQVNMPLLIKANGDWTFNGDSSLFQSVAQGEVRNFVQAYTVTDQYGAKTTSSITVQVTGANDAPTLTAGTFNVYEDSVINGRVNTARDVDAGAVLTFALTTQAPLGLTFNADGTCSFDGNNTAYQSLAAGQVQSFSVGYKVTDEWGASANSTMTINVTGRNDAPSLTGATYVVPQSYQGQSFVISQQQLLQGWTDVDADASLLARWLTADHATVTQQGSGYFATFTVAVEAGYTGPLTLGYWVTDGSSPRQTSLIVDVTDAARIGGTVTGTVIEARYGKSGTPNASGQLTIVDVGGDQSFRPVDMPSASTNGYGSFVLTAAGAWSFTLDNGNAAISALNKGQSLTDNFVVYAADGTAQTISVTIAGATDWTTAAAYTGGGDSEDNGSILARAYPIYDSVITGTEQAEVVTGGAAAQSFAMLGGDDTVYAQAGDDVVDLGNGNDAAFGQEGNDDIWGGLGDDRLFGDMGNDRLYGGDGADTLVGGSGSDIIDGGAGRDVLRGGYGADSLTGGADGDYFMFLSVLDRGDTITDFQRGIDNLSFQSIDANSLIAGDQAFAFSADGPAAHSLWLVQNGANVEVYADTDGDVNTAEFSLTLLNVTLTVEQNPFWVY